MQNYNILQKFLHDLILGNNFIKKSLYELEKKIFYKNDYRKVELEKHIFISGLPRSGSTALLNFFYKFNVFSSLTYSNMPFIMCPNLFSKIQFKSKDIKIERLHQDGINYDLSSPEAFDEIFFSMYRDNELRNETKIFIYLILKLFKKNRYLSKNNLNYKRIDLLNEIFPNSIFIIPFRNPLQQSFSLFKQHKRFKKLQNSNDFIQRYMNYLGHNEFGGNHIFWNKPVLFNDPNQLDYWIEQWILFYKNCLEYSKNLENCHFIKYENLNSEKYFKHLLSLVDLKTEFKNEFNLSFSKIDIKYDDNLLSDAMSLYEIID